MRGPRRVNTIEFRFEDARMFLGAVSRITPPCECDDEPHNTAHIKRSLPTPYPYCPCHKGRSKDPTDTGAYRHITAACGASSFAHPGRDDLVYARWRRCFTNPDQETNESDGPRDSEPRSCEVR